MSPNQRFSTFFVGCTYVNWSWTETYFCHRSLPAQSSWQTCCRCAPFVISVATDAQTFRVFICLLMTFILQHLAQSISMSCISICTFQDNFHWTSVGSLTRLNVGRYMDDIPVTVIQRRNKCLKINHGAEMNSFSLCPAGFVWHQVFPMLE